MSSNDKLRAIWTPDEYAKLRAAMAKHPSVLGKQLDPDNNVIYLEDWKAQK